MNAFQESTPLSPVEQYAQDVVAFAKLWQEKHPEQFAAFAKKYVGKKSVWGARGWWVLECVAVLWWDESAGQSLKWARLAKRWGTNRDAVGQRARRTRKMLFLKK